MEGCMSAMSGNATALESKGLLQLKSEHIPLMRMLNELLDLCVKIENGDRTTENFEKLRPEVIKFFSELDAHSEREEGVLFEMMAVYIGRDSGPIAVMEYEHNQAKSFIGTFLDNTKSGLDLNTEEKMRRDALLVKQAYNTLVDHFSKEENVLFPMAERMLTEEEKQELFERISIK